TEAQAKKMMKNYFFNEKKFFGEFIMPSISRDDPAYADQEYWRGRIWAPMNFLAYMAIRQSGQREAAAVLAKKSEELLLKEWRLHGHVHENYSGDDGMGCGSKSSDKFYHWGALLALITLIENGHINAPENPL
ncbi:MAG: hypothetical protein FWE82_08415, partial [Defluviitaleaceae bacterium]|nr:hypothetical protein [Defluviitaleaceae bacterium]